MSVQTNDSLASISGCLTKISNFFFSLSASIVMPVFAVIITVDVCLRYFLNSPLPWGIEVNGILLLIIFFSTLTKCEEENKNIQMELLYQTFSFRGQKTVDTFAKFTGAILYAVLAYESFRMVPAMYIANETGQDWHCPFWPFRLFIAVLSLLCMIRLIVDFFMNLRIAFYGRDNG